MAQEDKIIFCTGGGCTAKLGAGVLSHILEKLPRGEPDPNLLVGYDSRDDAAVYRITDDIALVQTVDFFPPMVDDPYTFGQIAAANALSDVYAMGGEVKTALNLVCFPESMDLNVLGEILRGGAEKVAEAGGILAGGHSIADTGVKYGHHSQIQPHYKYMEHEIPFCTLSMHLYLLVTTAVASESHRNQSRQHFPDICRNRVKFLQRSV